MSIIPRSCLLGLVLVGFTMAPVLAATPPQEALKKPVVVAFVDTPVQDVLDYLQDYCKVSIELDKQARTRRLPFITAEFKDRRLEDVLPKLLEPSELTYELLPDRIVVKLVNPELPLSEWGHLLKREDVFSGWIALFDGQTTFGWEGAMLAAGSLRGGATNSAFGDFEIVAHLNEPGALELAGQRVLAGAGMLRKRVQGKAGPIRLLDQTSVSMLRIRPLGMRPLFGGQELAPWKRIDRPTLAADKRPAWRVEGRAICAVGGPGALEHPELFGDFVLHIDVRTRARHANAGLFFRSRPGDFMNGYEAQIYNRCESNDPSKPSVWSSGSIDDRQLARRLLSRDFVPYRMTVLAHGPHIATWINGHQLIDWTDTRPPHDNPRQGLRVAPGTLQLQAHDPQTDVEFLGIQIGLLK